ncbi:MAG: phage baseplate assembly protein V [Brevundimonas sp.]|nr:phage baseplate assembly protein V [Brevundimonas sp.]
MTARSQNYEAQRQLAEVVREGVIDSVDLDAGLARVRIGDTLSPPIDWLMMTGDTTIWSPPTVGAAVVVICPEADIERGFILNGLPSRAFAPLFLGLTNAIRFRDGAQVSYDPEASTLDFNLPGAMSITAPAGVSITADVEITGNLHATGTITGDVDVIAAGISGKSHTHGKVAAGQAVSGGPQ